MGEENRGSSSSGTVMIVVAILGGLLLMGCCGGLVVLGLGGSLFLTRLQPQGFEVAPVASPPAVQRALDEMNKDLEPLKVVPDDPTESVRDPATLKEALDAARELKTPGDDSLPPAPALEEKKE